MSSGLAEDGLFDYGLDQRPRIMPPAAVLGEPRVVGQGLGADAQGPLLVGVQERGQRLGHGCLHEVAQVFQHR